MQIVSRNNSANTLVSVLMINAQGIMLSVQGQDYFLSYNRIPWMQDAPSCQTLPLAVLMTGRIIPLRVASMGTSMSDC